MTSSQRVQVTGCTYISIELYRTGIMKCDSEREGGGGLLEGSSAETGQNQLK